MKTLPKMEISDELDAQIAECIKASALCKADVIRQALRIGLAQFAARFGFGPPPLWLEERICEALSEPAEATSAKQFDENMAAIAKPGGQFGLTEVSPRVRASLRDNPSPRRRVL